MFNSRRGRLLAAIFGAGMGAAVVAPASAETLAEAIAMAYESNPTLQAQRATQRALDETYVQARTGWRPTLSATTQAGFFDTTRPGVGPDDRYSNAGSLSFTLSQPIYTGGRVAAAVSAAEADILQGRENLRRIEAQVLGNVVTAYVDTRRDQEALRIRQENVTVLQRQLEESRARFEVGEITRTDVAQSEARLAQAQAQLQLAQAQLAISRANYAAAVGQNPGDLAPEPSLASLLPPEVDQAFDLAEANSPQIRAAEYAEQASKARVAAARADRMPNVSVNGSVRFTGGTVDPFDRADFGRESSATVTVTQPLFTGGLTSSRIRQQQQRNTADRINIETARRSVIQTITQAWNQLLAARANITSTNEQVRAARIAAEGTRQEQQVGLRTTLDVLNAEQELRAAELSQVNARREEYVAAAAVLSAMGRLEARNLTPLTAQYDPKTNFSKLHMTWGWVPWEEPIAIVDSALTPNTMEKPLEPAVPVATTPAPGN